MAEVTVDEDLVYVPNGVACPKCGFSVVSKQWKPGALCPFEQAPFERATWKQYAEYLGKRSDEVVTLNHQLKESVNRLAKEAGYVFN